MKKKKYLTLHIKIILFKGLAFGKINGSIPQSIATVPSLIYLSSNITSHPGVPEKSFVIHNNIISINTIPTENSLQLRKKTKVFFSKKKQIFVLIYFGRPRSLYCLINICFKSACTACASGSGRI